MHLIFWQPVPSFHQQDFLETLATADWVDSVKLRYEKSVSEERIKGGWPQPKWKHIDAQPIESDAFPDDAPDVVHFFTGFHTHRLVWQVFKRLPPQRRSRAYAYAEAPALYDWKTPLRRLRYRLNAYALSKKLDGVFAVGEMGERFYRGLLGPDTPVHCFAYYDCCASTFPCLVERPPNTRVELLYVGRFIHLKGLDRLFRALSEIQGVPDWRLTMLGGGREESSLRTLAEGLQLAGRIRWQGAVPSPEVAAYYEQADVVIQPSRGDGWGMTLPEGLRHGCEIVATEACGAVDLVRPEYRLSKDSAHWPNVLTKVIQAGPRNTDQRRANQVRVSSLSAEAGVERLRGILEETAN